MTSREDEIKAFLAEAKWGDAALENMDADFSSRRFIRLHQKNGNTAVLMDADPEQKTGHFVVLAWLLRGLNLSSPEIIAEQRKNGLVLMEDFGEGNIGRLIDAGRHDNAQFYQRAAGVLAHLHQHFVPTTVLDLKLPKFTSAVFTKQVEKFLDGYLPYKLKRDASEDERKVFREAWAESLKPVDALPQSLMLRDFMPDNVMDLPERKSWRSFGLIDFQDAGIGPIAYDIASFCEVVRRDRGDTYMAATIRNYFDRAKPKCTLEALQKGCTILSAQRHARILGLLGGIGQKDPASPKLEYMPRVESYMSFILGDLELKPVKLWMAGMGLFV